ncbi:MAG: putative bifunctional diguanylate cyclase/phosphodiesterase [Acetobacteraceae bacterium]
MSLIVILDDRVTNRNIFSKLAGLVEEEAEVRAFGDAEEALSWFDANPPDLVITDFKMPNMDGAEFTRRLRNRPTGVDVPVIVITAYDDRRFRLRALEAGATDFLQSPVDHHEFLSRARNLLALRKQQQTVKRRATVLERELRYSERTREELLRDSRERLAQVIDTVPAMISATDRQGRCIFVNAYQAAISGRDPREMVNRPAAEIFGDAHAERSRLLDRFVFETGEPIAGFEEEIVDFAGTRHMFLTTKSPLRDMSNAVVSVLTTSLDITSQKQAEQHLRFMAHHDALTCLPNRSLLRDRIESRIAHARRERSMFALHFLDLDRFKGVNDAYGHHIGDRLLCAVAERLRHSVREGDIVARIGGDEFAVLQSRVDRVEDAVDLARRLVEVVSGAFTFDSLELGLSVSVGITLCPDDGEGVEELLKNADLAMYRAKSDGRDTYRFFAAEMNRQAQEAVAIENELRIALARRQFVLLYQPQVSFATGRVVGVEALLRWNKPGQGLVAPQEFLPMAEETGLIVRINEWVLREACTAGIRWREAGLPPLRVAVNLSPVQFRRQDVRRLVLDTLAETGFDPAFLELELTESILMENAEAAAEDIRALCEHGVRFSIDDFGTGYSSLRYVKGLPVSRLKIDQSFIANLVSDPNDAVIVRAIINLGHSLNLDVLAEGVETAEQYERLRRDGCDAMQGHFFSPALPAEAFAELLRRGESLVCVA